jgi:multiple sugar transport system ATP-binding protein
MLRRTQENGCAMARIALRGVTKSFRDAAVLSSVSLDIDDGEFLTLVGPSGCGKTTLLRIIAGLESQDSGDVIIGNHNVDALAPKQRDVAMVFQSYALYPYMTVAENISLPLVMRRMTAWQRLPVLGRLMPGAPRARDDIARDVGAVAEALAIGHLLKRRPAQLSGGQRQRVALARAMVRRPKAFLMDEPLSNLDAKLRVQARAEIAELHRTLGTTFVYVTHDQAEAMTMSDRVAVMLGGHLLQVAPPQTIYDDPATLEVARFIGTPEINVAPARVRADRCIETLGRAWPLMPDAHAGTEVLVGIRPEALRLETGEGNDRFAQITGTLRHRELLGCETLLHVAVDGIHKPVVARIDPIAGHALKLGQPVKLTVDPARALVFAADGRRIAARIAQPARRLVEVAHG